MLLGPWLLRAMLVLPRSHTWLREGPALAAQRFAMCTGPTPDGGFVFAYERAGAGTGEDIYLKKFKPNNAQ